MIYDVIKIVKFGCVKRLNLKDFESCLGTTLDIQGGSAWKGETGLGMERNGLVLLNYVT
jgi:hypothetical protein